MTDKLEDLARMAEHQEKQQDAASTWEPVEDQKPAGTINGVSDQEAAANAAESYLRIAEGVAKMFADPRLMLGDEEIASGRESLAPVIDKYGLAGTGDGKIPFWQEIGAGLYLGGLFKRFRRALAQLRADDEAKEQAKKQANQQANNQAVNQANTSDGEERKHQTVEQSQPLPSDQWVREVTDPDAPVWLR